MARNAPGRLRFVALFCLATCTVGYLMVLGGESVPRPAGRGTFDFIVLLAMPLATLVASVALPLIILFAAFWPFRSTDRKWEDPGCCRVGRCSCSARRAPGVRLVRGQP
jgi:hypothetical protein